MRHFKKNFILLGKSCARIDRDKRIKRIKEHEIQKKRLSWKRKKKKAHSSCSRNYYCFALSIVLGLMKACGIGGFGRAEQLSQEEIEERKPDIDVQLLTVNEYSRPGTEVEKSEGL